MTILADKAFGEAASTDLNTLGFARASSFSTAVLNTNGTGDAKTANNGVNIWCYLCNDVSLGNADYSVICRIRRDSDGSALQTEFGGVIRCSDDGNTHYRWYTNGTSFRLYKRLSGTDTELTTGSPGSPYTVTFFSGQVRNVKIEAIANNIKLYTQLIGTDSDYIERLSVNDSDISAVGKGGLWARATGGAYVQPGLFKWEHFQIDGTAAGGGGGGAKGHYYRHHILGAI